MFSNKNEKFTAIKLYSIDNEQAKINRPFLVENLLEFFESDLQGVPDKFDIHGPYRIPKGKTVGIRAFKSKLENRGHDDYYGLDGTTEDKFGFHILFNTPIGNNSYTELIIWCNSSLVSLDLKLCARELMRIFPVSSGFEIEFDKQRNISTESLTKRNWLGLAEEQISYKHLEWIQGFSDGEVRSIFKNNLLSKKQLNQVQRSHKNIRYSVLGDLYLVESVI